MNFRKSFALLLALLTVLSSFTVFSAFAERETKVSSPINTSALSSTVLSGGVAKDVAVTVGKTTDSYNVTWKTELSADTMYLQWCVAGFEETEEIATATSVKEGGTFRSKMTDLLPGTDYSYRIISLGGEKTEWLRVSSAKDSKSPFSFLLVGDVQAGAGTPDSDHANWDITTTLCERWFGDDIDFMLSVGDQANNEENHNEFDIFLSPDYIRKTPLMTVPGNHDNYPIYSEYFTYEDCDAATASEAGKYGGDYWIKWGESLFINLNSIGTSGAVHADFISRAINEYKSRYGEPQWKIVSLHYSAWSGAHDRWDSSYSEKFSPIFSENGIDAVLSGHDHVYVRPYIINGLEPVTDESEYIEIGSDKFGGIVDPEKSEVFYMTANSASGSKFYPLETAVELPWVYKSRQENIPNVTKVDVTGDMLLFTTYRAGCDYTLDDAVDFFAIHKREGVEKDIQSPVLTVPKLDYADDNFDPLSGIKAYDNFDGDLTGKIKVSGKTSETEEYDLTYTVTDKAGNISTAVRHIIPCEKERVVSSEETTWKYLDDGSMPFDLDDEDFTVWTKSGYDDSHWKEAKGGFGSINEEIWEKGAKIKDGVTPPEDMYANTLLGLYREDDYPRCVPNHFFRTKFNLSDPENICALFGKIYFDDAIEIYINGVRIERINLSPEQPQWGYSGIYKGLPSVRYMIIEDIDFLRKLNLKPTGNDLAIELYQGTNDSDDTFFDFKYLDAVYRVPPLPFTDVKEGDWFFSHVSRAYRKGLFAGTSATTFEPNTKMSRAMAWMVLDKTVGADLAARPGEKWYEGARRWAMANGVSDGTNPNNPLSREQFAVMFYNINGREEVSGSLDSFTDASRVSSWARDALIWATGRSLISGKGNGMLDPGATASRAEACAILSNYYS